MLWTMASSLAVMVCAVAVASCLLVYGSNIDPRDSTVTAGETVKQITLDTKEVESQSAPHHYRDCEDAYEHGVRASGVYTIQPDDDLPFLVYCDMDTDSGGWTVFQRREDGSVDFYRDWMDYARGFGDLTGEFWLGLRKIHRITALSSGAECNELRVDMEDFKTNTAYAKYDSFAIGDCGSLYKLTVSDYSGNAGDSLGGHSGHPFTTKDKDNDAWSSNCAVTYKGAWWYKACHHSNLNGLYLKGHHTSYADGVNWEAWKGYYYSLKFTEMKVRRQ